MTGQHLTDEQFTELLSGDYSSDANRHLQSCAQCQAEFQQVQTSIEDFAAAGLEWVEKWASRPVQPPIRAWQPGSTWSAAAAVLAAAVLFGVHQELRMRVPPVVPGGGASAARFETEVADDNRLMLAIDKEIHWQANSPIAVYSLAEGGRRPHSQAARRLAN